MSSDATGGYAELMPAHSTMLFAVPDSIPDEQAIFADPFAVSLHGITRHPPPAGGKALVWGAGSLGSCAVAILRALYPDVEVAVVARFDAQAALAEALGAHKVVRLGSPVEILEDLAAWSGGVLRPTMEGLGGLPMCHPGGIDVAYDTVGKPETFEIEVRLLKARGHPGQERRPRARTVGVEPALLQGDQLGGLERIRHRGGRGGPQARHRALPRPRRRRPDRPPRHADPHLRAVASGATRSDTIADQEHTGAIKVAIDPQESARRRGAGRMELAGHEVGVGHAHLALEPVGVAEEQAEDGTEVGDETVGRTAIDEPLADGVERLDRSGVQGQVVDAAPPEHRYLVVGLGVAFHLEDVELGVRADVDDREAHAWPARLVTVAPDGGVEHLSVEGMEPFAVVGQRGNMIEAVEQASTPEPTGARRSLSPTPDTTGRLGEGSEAAGRWGSNGPRVRAEGLARGFGPRIRPPGRWPA